jgi:hypothetical protein
MNFASISAKGLAAGFESWTRLVGIDLIDEAAGKV